MATPPKKKQPEWIELTPGGVFSRSKQKRRRVVDMIRVSAFANVLDAAPEDTAVLTEIKFYDRDGKSRRKIVPAALLVGTCGQFVAEMANLGYHWPPSQYHHRIVAQLANARPSQRKLVVLVPGWHRGKYLLGKEWITRTGDRSKAELLQTNGVKFPRITRTGSFRRWKKRIAKLAFCSSRIRLLMAAAFAAPVLRLLNTPSFGILMVGKSSKGKTFALQLAASACGFNDPDGIGSCKGTAVDIEQRMFGHRDAFMPLDEVGHLPPDEAADFLTQLAFGTSANKPKGRARIYEIAVQSPDASWRVVYGMTSEKLLSEIARQGKGGKRLTGDEVRLIELSAIAEGAIDIFDSSRADEVFGQTPAEREGAVTRLTKIACENQGQAMVEFLRKLVNDPEANERLEKSIKTYLEETRELCPDSPQLRIARLFATVYAAACLAIEYRVLPWQTKPTLRDIKKCMLDAFALMEGHARTNAPSPPALGPSDDDLVAEFAKQVKSAEIIELDGRDTPPSGKRVARADGFRKALPTGKRRLFLKASALKAMAPDHGERSRLVRLLQKREIMDPGRADDTATHQLQIAGQTIAHYRLDAKRLLACRRG